MSWRKNSSRNFQFEHSSTPYNIGPGSYELENNTKKQRPPSAAFKNREKRTTPFDKPKYRTPAPGNYDPLQIDTHIKISSAFKSNSTRKVYDISNNPSPADYGQLNEWGVIKQRRQIEKITNKPISPNVGQDINGYDILPDGSLRPKKAKVKDSTYLGPGTYNLEYSYGIGGHSMKESYRKCDLRYKENNPGPGAYETCINQFNIRPKTANTSRIRPSSVTSAKRRCPVEKDPYENAPKGGELKHQPWNKSEFDTSSSTFKSKTKRELWKMKSDTPSPTLYQNTERRRPESAKAAFGQRTPRFLDDDGNGVPGPGAYEVDDRMIIVSPNSSGYTGRHAYDVYSPGNDVPGPGSYETKSMWERNKKKDRPSSVFASNTPRSKNDLEVTPGPADYNAEMKSTNYKIAIRSSRSKKTNNFFAIPAKDNPAPDQYKTERAFNRNGITIPKDRRFDRNMSNTTPGPGSYKTESDTLIKKSFNSDLLGIV